MQVNPLNSASAASVAATASPTLRLVTGDLSQVQSGVIVAATVLRVSNGEASINLAGAAVTVRASIGLSAGDVLSVRLSGGEQPTLELISRTPARIAEPPTPSVAAPESPPTATTIASALLQGDRPPPLGETAPALLQELARLPNEIVSQPAVKQVQVVLQELLSPVPTAEQVQAVVERGGELHEANVARRAQGEPTSLGTDLKGSLLQLLKTVPQMAAVLPSAQSTLDGIEARQAAQVLTQEHGGAFVFQVPFADGPTWRTVRLAIEPDRQPTDAPPDATAGFRVMMHVPLAALGEIWLEAQAIGTRFQAAFYSSQPTTQQQLRAELSGLRTELQATGFESVQLDVRTAAELTDRQRRRMTAMHAGLPESVGIIDVRA
jgi:hypothetical protein